jgi:hypothetical protein
MLSNAASDAVNFNNYNKKRASCEQDETLRRMKMKTCVSSRHLTTAPLPDWLVVERAVFQQPALFKSDVSLALH